MHSGITKNNNNLKRKVLIEKDGNPIQTTSIEIELVTDHVLLIN